MPRITNRQHIGLAIALFLVLAPTAQAVPVPSRPRVAVFFQPGFPFNNQSTLVSPKEIADDLEKAGVATDLLGARDLSDPARLTTKTYAAVVLPYGNAYPQAAFPALRAFHRAGGALVLSGVPFTHAIRQDASGAWQDMGHESAPALFGAEGIGVGGFRNGIPGHTLVAGSDPLGLARLGLNWGDGP